jgi:hypothetical protein
LTADAHPQHHPNLASHPANGRLTFDLTGALYSHLSVGDPPGAWMPAFIGLVLMGGSYVSYRMRLNREEISHQRLTGFELKA